MDVHFTPPTIVAPVIAHGNLVTSLSFHNLDWDGEIFDSDNREPSGSSRPLQVQ